MGESIPLKKGKVSDVLFVIISVSKLKNWFFKNNRWVVKETNKTKYFFIN